MGKVTGFLEFGRVEEPHEPTEARKKHYREFYLRLSDEAAGVQGARCMDCGVPFCMSGCPVNNIIPEFTGRICPAPCEEACVLRINADPVGIKPIEHAIIDKAWEEGWVRPLPAAHKTGKKVAIVGSGPAGLACAQQLARAGHDVGSDARESISPDQLKTDFEAIVLAAGAEQPRDLPIPGRALDGVHYAMDFLPLQNKRVAGDGGVPELSATDKHVVIIGGGDTGSDCVGTSNRHGARSITQFEVLPMPPDVESNPVWPYWPVRLRTSSSHEEGVNRDWSVATKEFAGENGKLKTLRAVRLEWKDGKPQEVPGSQFEMPADLVLLAMGFVSPLQSMLEEFGVQKDARGNARADTDGARAYVTSVPKVFAAGDVRRGQSLVVWAIREGRQCARSVDESLMGTSKLPR